MKNATIDNTDFSVEVLPTEFGYSPLSDMKPGTYPVEGEMVPMNVIDIQYSIFAGKWKKTVEGVDDQGEPTTQTVWVDFTTPVLLDTGKQTIPYGLYLMIEDYRNAPSTEKLAAINANIAGFPFQNSMEGFVLQVSEIS